MRKPKRAASVSDRTHLFPLPSPLIPHPSPLDRPGSACEKSGFRLHRTFSHPFNHIPILIPKMIRLGIIDFDSSHSIEFTRRFNQVCLDPSLYVEGARVVAGCPGVSKMSPERIPLFTEQVRQANVKIVDRPQDLFGKIDAVLILSLQGDAHLPHVRTFLEAGVPAFVDKPFATDTRSAREMAELARQHRLLLWSSSGMRFLPELRRYLWREERCLGAFSFGPAKLAEGNPGLFHYGIHAVEALFTMLGPGCESVVTTRSEGAEVITGRWRDGRLGTVRGNREGHTAYGAVAFHEESVRPMLLSSRYSYTELCRAIVKSFETGQPAVPIEETIEIIGFIEAAQESARIGGTVSTQGTGECL